MYDRQIHISGIRLWGSEDANVMASHARYTIDCEVDTRQFSFWKLFWIIAYLEC